MSKLTPVEMSDGTYGKSSHSGGGGCVVARAEEAEVQDLRDVPLAELLSDPATAAVRARVVATPEPVVTLHLPSFNSAI